MNSVFYGLPSISGVRTHPSRLGAPVRRKRIPGPWKITTDFDAEEYLSCFIVEPVLLETYRNNVLVVSTINFGHPCNNNYEDYIVPIPMIYCLTETAEVAGAAEPVILGATSDGVPSFVLQINWPGYSAWQKDLMSVFWSKYGTGAILTYKILAHLIARECESFILHNWRPIAENDFMIGPGGVDLYRLNLAYITKRRDNIWHLYLGGGLVLASKRSHAPK
ncbi:hypothetical protein BDN70DRAFT_898247 [Pholiota conissans]|uniref:Uncharacterized protein n=1 Tax=Pholiota conissans TaxID=109636 RepID=A0A9P6CWL4_9AGAR|nr:hypothetical protein BDN70DRAFT_898247 [Pholiota conissans]